MNNIFLRKSLFTQSGVAAVEFGLLIVLLLMIVAAVIEFGRAFWYYDALTKATRDGARLVSMADVDAIETVESNAIDMVVAAGNDAKVIPQLTTSNVEVECEVGGTWGNCTDGTAPDQVRVSIVNFSMVIGGGWIPILPPPGTLGSGPVSFGTITLAPHTTMRYMQ